MIKKIFNRLNGLYYRQEYLCLAKESLDESLYVYLLDGKRIVRDITRQHLFVGYCPLILALAANEKDASQQIELAFTQTPRQPNEFLERKDAIALLYLELIKKQQAGDAEILYYQGYKASHHFISRFHQYVLSLDNRIFNKRPANVYLHDNLYKQVQIAYSIPRTISLITVGNNDNLFNLFPTDLHGSLNDGYYISSLRHDGKACAQVMKAGRIVLSDMDPIAYKWVYSLGKNHMCEMGSPDQFPFGAERTLHWQLPLPDSALRYRELEVADTFKQGIHRIFLYKIMGEQTLQPDVSTLSHIHNVYATWRHNKGLSGNYLLR